MQLCPFCQQISFNAQQKKHSQNHQNGDFAQQPRIISRPNLLLPSGLKLYSVEPLRSRSVTVWM